MYGHAELVGHWLYSSYTGQLPPAMSGREHGSPVIAGKRGIQPIRDNDTKFSYEIITDGSWPYLNIQSN